MRRAALRPGSLWPGLLLVSVFPATAEAHTTVKGMNDFWSGALHPLMTPTHLLVLLALALWMGQRSPLRIGAPLAAFSGCAAIGLLLTLTGLCSGIQPTILTGIALVAGALVALELEFPVFARSTLYGVGALVIGMDSGLDSGTRGAVLVTLFGTWMSLTISLMNLTYYVSLAADQPRKWLHVGIRVAGSWIVAISLLMLAFALRK